MSGFTSSGQALDKTENYDYDACDQLTCVDGVGFEYDLNGNLAKKRDDMAGDMVYKFNYANRLREVLFADGTKAQYVCKSDGMRISRADRTGKTTKYYWDSSNIPEALNEADEDGNITLNLFPGTGFKSTKNGNQNSTQWRWFITDHLGSVIALTDNNGITTDEYAYDEYGTLINTKGTSHNPYKYIGQQYDEETGLIYLRARYYASETGRFVSRDPIGIRGGINEYGYGLNNPANRKDPTGMNSSFYSMMEQIIRHYVISSYNTVQPGEMMRTFFLTQNPNPGLNDPDCSSISRMLANVYYGAISKYSTHVPAQLRCNGGWNDGHYAFGIKKCPKIPLPDSKNVVVVLDPWNSNLRGMTKRSPQVFGTAQEWGKSWGCTSVDVIPQTMYLSKMNEKVIVGTIINSLPPVP